MTARASTLLREPDFWEKVAERIGEHPYVYDMDDDSHRLDVVQIVCDAAALELDARGDK